QFFRFDTIGLAELFVVCYFCNVKLDAARCNAGKRLGRITSYGWRVWWLGLLYLVRPELLYGPYL
ncbi:hypothetical protein RFZ44_28415, partial [Acinetobacter sp. 163]|nr:hypothetical protein [Acinetobacter sp. 163]